MTGAAPAPLAKLVIEVEDQPGGGLAVRFSIDGMATAATATSNTAAQNVAIVLAEYMREMGLEAPDLSGK